jgi:agmatine deiminase
LQQHLGVERIVWLGNGLIEDRDTDGHVDLIAAFTRPARCSSRPYRATIRIPNGCSKTERSFGIRGIDVVEMPHLPYVEVAGEMVAAGYMNLYVCNRAVIVPITGADSDEAALAVIGGAFPDREIVPVPGACSPTAAAGHVASPTGAGGEKCLN